MDIHEFFRRGGGLQIFKSHDPNGPGHGVALKGNVAGGNAVMAQTQPRWPYPMFWI